MEVKTNSSVLLRMTPVSWYIQVTTGTGLPVALQYKVVLLPSVIGLGHLWIDMAGSSAKLKVKINFIMLFCYLQG